MSRPITRRRSSSEPNPGVQTKVRIQPKPDSSGRPKRAAAVAPTSNMDGKVVSPSSKRLRSSSNGREPTRSRNGTEAASAISARRAKQPLERAKSPKKTASTIVRVKNPSAIVKRGENGVKRSRSRVRNVAGGQKRMPSSRTGTVGTKVESSHISPLERVAFFRQVKKKRKIKITKTSIQHWETPQC
jgi:hypothetical protein